MPAGRATGAAGAGSAGSAASQAVRAVTCERLRVLTVVVAPRARAAEHGFVALVRGTLIERQCAFADAFQRVIAPGQALFDAPACRIVIALRGFLETGPFAHSRRGDDAIHACARVRERDSGEALTRIDLTGIWKLRRDGWGGAAARRRQIDPFIAPAHRRDSNGKEQHFSAYPTPHGTKAISPRAAKGMLDRNREREGGPRFRPIARASAGGHRRSVATSPAQGTAAQGHVLKWGTPAREWHGSDEGRPVTRRRCSRASTNNAAFQSRPFLDA
jgi:hypothetical protein